MTYSIGKVASDFGLTHRALRFYEQCGLLKPKREGPNRRYSENDVLRIGEIVRGLSLGLTVAEVKGMLEETSTGPHLVIPPEKAKSQIAFLLDRVATDTKAIEQLEPIAALEKT